MSERIPSVDGEADIIRLFLTEKRGDFDFHVERFRKMAEEYSNKPWIWRLWTRGAKTMTAADFAAEEHFRGRADVLRRMSEEFEAWQRDLQPVIRRILLKRDDPDGAGKDIHPLILILGGGMRGPYSAGQALGLFQMGLEHSFDNVVGISAGAGTATYFSGGEEQARRGASIFYEECTTKDFLDFLRLHQVMNVSLIAEIMRNGAKKLDETAIKKAKHELYLAATRQDTLEAELLNAKTANPDIAAAAEASMAIPILFRKAVEVNNIPYIDGGFDYLPVKKIIEQFHPTDILILAQRPFDRLEAFHLSFGEFLLVEMASKLSALHSMKVIEKVFRMNEEFRKSLEYIKEHEYKGVNIGILWPPDFGLTNVTTDANLLKAATLESARDAIAQFGGEQPDKIELYEIPGFKG